jgi:ABC-type uncharacterized transport system permease subunit
VAIEFLNERLVLWIGSLCYAAGFSLGLFALLRDRHYRRPGVLTLLGIGFAVQTIGLYLRGHETHSCPVGNLFEVFQFLTWSAVLLYFLVGPAFRMSLLGFFSAGFAAIVGVVSLGVRGWDTAHEPSTVGGPLIKLHAAMAIFSYGVFAILALVAAMYLIQAYGLKRKQFRGMFRLLPSIMDLDAMNLRLLVVGSVVFTVSVGAGAFLWFAEQGVIQAPKLVMAVAVWAAYMVLLALRVAGVLVARRFAVACLVVFGAALVALLPIDAYRGSKTDASSTQNESGM